MIIHNEVVVTWTSIDNAILREPGLSWRAKGLYAYLLGLPDGWRVNSTDLANRATDGLYAVRSIMDEMEAFGLLRREKRQADDGKWSTHIFIYGAPVTDDGFTGVGGLHESGPESSESPTAVEPTVGRTDGGQVAPLGKTQPGRTQEEEPILLPELASETEATRSLAQLELDGIKNALDDLGLVPATKSGWGIANRVATMIRDQGGDGADVIVRASLMAKDWGASKVTLTSLEKHWNRFDPGKIGTLTQADIDAFARATEKQASRDRLLREIDGSDAETEAYQADVRMLRDRARSQGRSDELDKGDYR